jgi:hypothetical protein
MMIECPTNHHALPELFDLHVPNNPALWAVFEGRHTGSAVVDDLQRPWQCVVRTDATLTYASRNISPDFLARAIDHYCRAEEVWLVHPPGATPGPTGSRVIPNVEFYDYNPGSAVLADLRMRLPEGFSMRTIDMALLQQCLWRDGMVFFCGSLKNFLANDLGICMLCGEEIIVETYATALGSPYAEIGGITHEPYRGKGYMPTCIAHLIAALEQRGYHGYWSCEANNLASIRVARKLGFTVEKPYEIWEYAAAG